MPLYIADKLNCHICDHILEGLESIDDECDVYGIHMVKIQDPQLAKRYSIKTFPAMVYFRFDIFSDSSKRIMCTIYQLVTFFYFISETETLFYSKETCKMKNPFWNGSSMMTTVNWQMKLNQSMKGC